MDTELQLAIKAFARKLGLIDKKLRAAGDRSKYVPHQGACECERRRNQRGNA